jgi:glycosyltransferase involved in cell wall biosynthesis
MAKPVIATAVGGSVDQVVDGKTGFLVPPGDEHAIAEKIKVLLHDEALRKTMGEAGLERIRRHFDLQQMVHKVERIYLSAITP